MRVGVGRGPLLLAHRAAGGRHGRIERLGVGFGCVST
jgi:hypothetical protein